MTFSGKVPDKTKKSSQKNCSKAEGLRIFFRLFIGIREEKAGGNERNHLLFFILLKIA
jgi:hypothetical protein